MASTYARMKLYLTLISAVETVVIPGPVLTVLGLAKFSRGIASEPSMKGIGYCKRFPTQLKRKKKDQTKGQILERGV